MENSNVMDLLLKSDISKIKLATKNVKIQSLSETFGQDVIFKLQAIPVKRYNELQESAVDENDNVDMQKAQFLTILDGVIEPNLKSKELMEHFKAHSPFELIELIFKGKAGEVVQLYHQINKLCGVGKKAVEEVKN